MSETLNVTGDVGETRPPHHTSPIRTVQEKSGPSRQDERTPANLGKLEKGVVPLSPPTGGMVIVDDVDSPVSGDGTPAFDILAEIVTYGIYQSVSCLNEKSRPESVAMLRRIIEAERAVLDAADALLTSREKSIARAVGVAS